MEQIVLSIDRLFYTYPGAGPEPALKGLSFQIRCGERIALLGANGSGKSTLLKCLNGVLSPPSSPPGGQPPVTPSSACEKTKQESPAVTVFDGDGIPLNPASQKDLERIRRRLATVLQDPDDQIISSSVEEDTAFGPENLGLSVEEIRERVDRALAQCGLGAFKGKQIRNLSGGEKQRLALAGVLALGTEIIALDEAVSMLDPHGREGFLSLLDELQAAGKTIIQVTHSLKEALRCGRCLVLYRGELVFDGSPARLLEREELETWGFTLPESIKAARLFASLCPGFPPLSPDAAEAAESIAGALRSGALPHNARPISLDVSADVSPGGGGSPAKQILLFDGASHEYNDGSGAGSGGIKNVSFEIDGCGERGQLIALIGQSGSGKTTALKHVNALLLPKEGRVVVLGGDTLDKKTSLPGLRMKAALSVQSPESALFERYVADDVAFGPKNSGIAGAALLGRVKAAMKSAGLPFDEFADRETSSLSGGEKRRAAIAGTAAMRSEILLLDEPLASLDGFHQKKILGLIEEFRETGKTVIISTHSMDTAALADKVGIMAGGRLAAFAPPRLIFGPLWDSGWGLALPWAAAVGRRLAEAGLIPAGLLPLNADELFSRLSGAWRDEKTNGPPNVLNACKLGETRPDREKAGEKRPGKERRKKGLRRKTGVEVFQPRSFGQFLDRPSALRNLGAGKKLLLLLILAITAMAGPVPYFPIAALAFTIAAAWFAGRVGPTVITRGFFSMLPWLLILGAVQLFPSLDFTRPLSLILRVACLSVLISLYAAVTPLSALLRSLNRLLSLPARLGFPSRDFSLAIGIAMRFVPVLGEEAEKIVSAQLSRGGNKGRLRMAFSLVVPLFLRALERAETLTMAMLLRCYRQ